MQVGADHHPHPAVGKTALQLGYRGKRRLVTALYAEYQLEAGLVLAGKTSRVAQKFRLLTVQRLKHANGRGERRSRAAFAAPTQAQRSDRGNQGVEDRD